MKSLTNSCAFLVLRDICCFNAVEITTFLLKMNGVSQSELARRLGVTPQAVSKALKLADGADSQKVKQEVIKELGFNPWEMETDREE